METSPKALLQHLNVERRYLEQYFEPLQKSATTLRKQILKNTQADQVLGKAQLQTSSMLLCMQDRHFGTCSMGM